MNRRETLKKTFDLIWSIEGYETLDEEKLKSCFMINYSPANEQIWKFPDDLESFLKDRYLTSIYIDNPDKPGGLLAAVYLSKKDKLTLIYDFIPDSEPEHIRYYLNKKQNREFSEMNKVQLK